MLEVKNLGMKLGDRQLFDDLSFSVSAGEMLCITGASGCGKTSLLKAVMGFFPTNRGFISIDGEQVTAETAPAFRRMMAYLPQDLSFPCSTVEEMVKLPFSLRATAETVFSKDNMIEEWQKLNLEEDLFYKKVSEISGGQRQRMMIATTCMLNKKIILVDEPTSALDEDSSLKVADYLLETAKNGAAIVAVSHNSLFASRCFKTISL